MNYVFTELFYIAAVPCTKKDFGQGSVALVCNEGHQDTFDPIGKSAKGIVQVFTSTKSGKRLEKTQAKFGEEKQLHGYKWEIKVDRSKSYQKVLGFGSSFSDAAVLGIGKMSSKLQRQILTDFFGEHGIELSMARTTIAGSDFSTRPYSYDDHDWDWDLKQFSLVDEDTKYRVSNSVNSTHF